MSRLHFSRRELGGAFHALRQEYADGLARAPGQRPRGAVLLGLYAVECGLKLLLLSRRGLHTTGALAPDDDAFTHDPNFLLGLLGQPARFRAATVQSRDAERVQPSELHQLYRYGARVSAGEEAVLTRAIDEVVRFVEENSP